DLVGVRDRDRAAAGVELDRCPERLLRHGRSVRAAPGAMSSSPTRPGRRRARPASHDPALPGVDTDLDENVLPIDRRAGTQLEDTDGRRSVDAVGGMWRT